MSLEILSQINQNYLQAVDFHRQQADAMWFMSLPGMGALHEYQHAEESQTQRKLKQYILTTYRVPVYDAPLSGTVTIFQKLTDGKDRKTLTSEQKWRAVQDSWTAYADWELGTLELYEQLAKELLDAGHIADFIFVQDIVKDVSEEYRDVSDILNAMREMEFDLPTLTSMQLEMQEKYTEKLRNLYKEIPRS